MSNFINLGQFGNLTTQTGYKLTFKDFDLNGDKQISEEEFSTVLKDNGLDVIELSGVDNNKDKILSEDEFVVWEQKIEMEKAVNDLQGRIAFDFAGQRTQYIPQLLDELKAYLEEFSSDYQGDVKNMAKAFAKSLPNKYEEIKFRVRIEAEAQEVVDKCLGQFIDFQLSNHTVKYYDLSQEDVQKLGALIEQKVQEWIATLNHVPTPKELNNFVYELLFKTDGEKMKDDVNNYQHQMRRLGNYISANEFEKMKGLVTELFENALVKGVDVILGGKEIKSADEIEAVLASYTDPVELMDAVNELISSWNDDNLIVKTKREKDFEVINTIPTEEFEITLDNTKTQRGREQVEVGGSFYDEYDSLYGWNENRLVDKAKKFLNKKVRREAQEQLEVMLKGYGIPFESFAKLFNETFNSAVAETLDISSLFQGRRVNILDLTEACLSIFNTKLQIALEELRQPTVAPNVDEAPTTDEVPVAEESPAVEETPTVEEAAATENTDLETFKNEVKTLIEDSKRDLYSEYHPQLDTYGKVRMFNAVFVSTSTTTMTSIQDNTLSAETIVENFKAEFRKNLDEALDIMKDD